MRVYVYLQYLTSSNKNETHLVIWDTFIPGSGQEGYLTIYLITQR